MYDICTREHKRGNEKVHLLNVIKFNEHPTDNQHKNHILSNDYTDSVSLSLSPAFISLEISQFQNHYSKNN